LRVMAEKQALDDELQHEHQLFEEVKVGSRKTFCFSFFLCRRHFCRFYLGRLK
jgi:hypothetical protein